MACVPISLLGKHPDAEQLGKPGRGCWVKADEETEEQAGADGCEAADVKDVQEQAIIFTKCAYGFS